MQPDEIRRKLKEEIVSISGNEDRKTIEGLTSRSVGHEVGRKTEDWLINQLKTIDWDVKPHPSHEFICEFLEQVERNEQRIEKQLDQNWWYAPRRTMSPNFLVTKKQKEAFLEGEDIDKNQQAAGDIVLFYGNELPQEANKIILLNVKGHNKGKKSRDPNIISGQRLMQFFKEILENDKLEEVNYWIIGIDFVTNETSKVEEIHLKDLFKLDLKELPQINFDAAIEVQWHIKDMVEKDQDRLEFVKNFADIFLDEWQDHYKRKDERYKDLVRDVKNLAGRLHP